LSKVVTEIWEEVELNQPILLVGLPGAGRVAKTAVDHLIRELRAKPFARIYSWDLPSQVHIDEGGVVNLPSFSIYLAKGAMQGRDVLIFTGELQGGTPQADYAITEAALTLSKRLGVTTVYSFAAYITGMMTEEPKIYGAATSSEFVALLSHHNVLIVKDGVITGMNGLSFAMSKLLGMEGMCILAETSGYQLVDARAAKVILKKFMEITGIKIGLGALDMIIAETTRLMEQERERERERSRRRLEYIA